MALYNILKALVLLINALVIINERFLKQIGMIPSNPTDLQQAVAQGQQQQGQPGFFSIMTDQNVKFVVHYPLIVINIVFILFESLFG